VGGLRKTAGELTASTVWINGAPGLRIELDGELATAVAVTVVGGRVTHLFAVANPNKLERVDAEAALTR